MWEQIGESYRKHKGISLIFFFFGLFGLFWKSHILPGFLGDKHFCPTASLASLKYAEALSQISKGKVILSQ